MADEIPVCDVLCEAMEYLSKLGSNLRTRSEALKEKKIKKDKLKNAHAVQKAANKVLLICQLSKKSLDNVESGVKKILTLVDASQTSTCDGGKTSNAEASSSKKIDYQYFEYKQQKLKIAKKVSIKHYLSAKVRARSMPISMQEKYPVFYDCKLYRSRKRKALRESFNRRERSDRQSPERINSHGKVDSSPRKAIELTSHELRSPEREAHSKEKNDNDGSDSKEDVDSLGKKGNNKHASTEGDKDKKTRCDPNKSLKDSKNSPDESNSDSVESDSSEVLTKDVNSNDADDKDRHRQADSSKKVTITQKKSKRISSSDSEQGTVSHSKKNNDKERLSPAKDSPRKNYIDKCDHSNKEKKIESDSDASCKTNKDHVKAKNQNSDKERRDSNCHSVDSDDPKKLTDDPESSGIDGKEDNMNSERNYDKYDSDDSVTTTNNYNDGKKESNIRASVDRSSESENSATNNSENQKKQTYAESKVTLKVDGEENTIELNKTENLDQSDRPTPLEKPEISKSDSKIEHRKESDRTLNDDKYVENKKTDKKDKDSVIVSTESEKIKVKSYKKIYDSSDSDTSKSALVKSRTKKERKKKEHINKKYKEKRRRSFCISSDSDVDKDVHEKEKAHKKLKHIKVIEDSDSGNEATKDSEVNMSKENVEDEDKEHKSEKSDEDIALEPQKPLIKLVNINKLLKPDLLKNEQSTKPSTDEQQNKESGGVKNSKVKKTIKCSAMKSMNNNDRVEQKLKKVRYEDEENFWEPKRKEVEAFVPKPVTINIVRCTKLSELLRQHSLKKVTQCGSVICELNDDTISLRESTKHSTNDVDASNEKTVQLSDISTVKRALLVDSDSEKSESPVVINLTNEADNDKKILSDESDSEENDDRGNNKDMLTADAKKKNKPADDFETGKNILLDESDSEKNEQNSKSQVNKNSKSKRNLKDYETVKNTLLDESDSEKKDGEENEDLKAVRKHKSAQSKDENDKSFSVINNKQDSNKDSQRTAKNKISKSKRRKRDDETHAKKSLLDNSDSEKNEQDIGEDLQGTTKKSVRKGSNEDKETENVKNNLLEDSDSEKNDNEDTNLKTTKNSKSKGNNEDDETDKVKNNLLTDSDTEKNNEQSSGKEFEENDKSDNLDESDSEKNDEQSGDEKELTATNNKFKESNQEDETDNVKKKLLDDSDSEKNDEQDIGEDLQGTTKKSVRNCSNEDKETENVKNNLLEDSDSEKNDNEDTNLKTTKNSKSKGNNEDDETDKVKNNLLTDSDTEKNNEQSSGKEFEENDKSDNLGESDSEKNDEQSGDEKELTATNNKFKESNQEDETDNVKKKLLDDSDSEKNDDQASNNIENSKQNESSQDEEDVSLNENLQESNVENTLDPQSTEKEKNNKNKTPDKEIVSTNEDPDKVKSSLLNDSSDDSVNTSNKRRRKRSGSTPQSKRKHMMESMHAKKMLLTYSSSSDTEDEKLKDVFKEIKESLLKEITSDDEKQSKQSHRRKLYTSSDSDEDILKKVKKRKIRSKISSEKAREMTKKNEELTNEDTEEQSNINQIDGTMDETSNSSKMGRSREKGSGSSSHNSDNQDDKEVDGLSNLNTLTKSRRHRDSPTNDKASTSSKKKSSKAAPLITGEGLLEVPLSSDDDSAAADDAMEEDLPPVALSGLNGGSIGHLAKDDLLEDSDSSSSVEKDKDESSNEKEDDEDAKRDNESDTEKNVKTKRRKAHAISSDSEAGSSRPKGSNRDARLSDFEDSEEEGSEPVKKSKRKKKGSDSDASGGSSNEGSKKKRRRIKQIDDSDASGSDSENEGKKHGRKNIRKVMGKNQLEEATKKAAREEKERIARIADRQKMYNNLEFDESGKPDEVILDKVVLDFDPETKEPLIELDRGLVKKLKPHQANGIKFMWDACFESVKRIKKDRGSGCILAHCMGLGKTLQVVSLTHTLLTHSELTSVNRVLVVCPLSTVLNWVNEFRMWLKFAERDFEVDVYELSRFKQNSERAFQLSQWFQHGGVCVLGYEMFRNLSADNPKKFKKKMLKTFQESLVDPGPDMVVCDEGHLLKNEKTSLSQSMNRVKTHRRIVLTGTPLQNNLKEYYCMVQFVKPNLLGKYNEYLNRFVNPITNGQYTDSTEHDIRVMKRRSHVLHKMLDGAVQRRDYGVLAPFLPPKHEYVLFITLTEVQIKLYQHYLDNYSRRPLPGKSSGFLFPDFQSLQRIWTHPLVLKYNSERYEIMQQKKRDKEEEDSEGSLADFIDDDSTPDETSEEESSDDSSDMSDDSRKKSKKKKSAKKNKKDSKISTRRGTRANPVEHPEEEDVKDISEVIEVKNENPTEWWIPMVTDDEVEDIRNSHKLVLLFEILRQCEAIGDKLLVFSQSLYSLDLIEHFLGKVDEATQEGRVDEKLGGHVGSWSPGIDYFRLDGSTSCENRSIWCKNFNREDNPRARLFLISTRAGGLGINLVAANRVVIFDVSWNPSHDVQSIFRVYRFGQKKPCYVYRFLAMGTMEEKIYERQVTKQAISKRVIDEQQIDRHYAENDLAELYKFEPRQPEPRPVPLVPKDRLFAEMLKEHENVIYKFHEHDSLLENKEEETLSEEERKAAWEDFENEKNRPPPVPFVNPWPMHNGMVPNLLAQQQQQLAYAALATMLRKDMPNLSDDQIRGMLPLIYGANPGLMQKLGDIYKYPQPGMMNPAAMMNSVMNPAGGAMGGGGTSGLQYEPPWARDQRDQQNMRLQQLLQQQNQMGAKYYAGGLGSRDPVAMALQQQRAREIMLGEHARQRGRPPLQPRAPPAAGPPGDVVNLADSD